MSTSHPSQKERNAKFHIICYEYPKDYRLSNASCLTPETHVLNSNKKIKK
ncbi:hypothetical protein Scep_005213 [Stephania cephalantha]|uniref:Uncharacterized protein n=1 Tax=Stephania cephalantha TaxID=152367 RepID=A0AAP0KWT0_9MAGN